WVRADNQRTDVTEAKRGERRGLDRAVSCFHIRWGAQPDQVLGLWLNQRIYTIQRQVSWNASRAEDVNQTTGLEQRGTSLGVTSQCLLRDHKQWLGHIAANSWPQDGVQFRLIRVIGVGRGVVLGQYRDIIWSQTQTGQALGQAGVLPATASAQSTQSWSRNGGVGTVAVGRRVRNDRVDRQTHLTSQGTANQK